MIHKYSLLLGFYLISSIAYVSTMTPQVSNDWYDYEIPSSYTAANQPRESPDPFRDFSLFPLKIGLSNTQLIDFLKHPFSIPPEETNRFHQYYSVENEQLNPLFSLMAIRYNLRQYNYYKSVTNLHDSLVFYISENNLITGYCALDILHFAQPQQHAYYTQITQYPQDKQFLKNQLPNVEGRKIQFYRIPRQDDYIERYAFIRFSDTHPYDDGSKKNALAMRAFYPEAVEPLIISRIQQVLVRHLTLYHKE